MKFYFYYLILLYINLKFNICKYQIIVIIFPNFQLYILFLKYSIKNFILYILDYLFNITKLSIILSKT